MATPKFALLLVFLSLLTAGCATNPVTGEQDFVLMSEAQEVKLGRDYHQQILKQYRVYQDQALQDYVEELGQRLVKKSHRKKLPFRFTVLDSPEVNAFALPGGYIYITRGIMAYLNSEAELSGVIGHEIGHVTARHSVRQHASSTATGILGAVLTVGVGAGADLFGSLGQAMVSGYGREHELEADRLGAEYLARVGYDPDEMIAVIGVLKNQEEYERQRATEEGREARAYHGVFASHPENDERLKGVIKAARKLKTPTTLADNRDIYLNKIDGMVYGAGEHEGVIRDRNFYHKSLGIGLLAPEGWQIENLPDRLLLFPKSRDAIVQVLVEPREEVENPEKFLRSRLKGKELDATLELSQSSLQGFAATTEGQTHWGPRQVRYAVWLKDDQAYSFAAAAQKSANFQTLDQEFLGIVNSFHALDEHELALATLRLVIKSPAGKSFVELANDSPLKNAAAQLRLLNGKFPTGEPEQHVKIVQ